MIAQARLRTYANTSTELACLSDLRLAKLLDESAQIYSGIGGNAAILNLNGAQVFVKKVPLTDLERQKENVLSTANLFELPLSCQYGVFSVPTPGFGAYRELASHVMTTNWVISGECPSFPMLYHWRILPSPRPSAMSADQIKTLDEDVGFWDDSKAVRNRLEATYNASFHVLLLLEYFPSNLDAWFRSELTKGEEAASRSVSFVEKRLNIINTFTKSQAFNHFDAHFRNILTDGEELYFSDFGLSVSKHFELSEAERQFQKNHHNYDQCGTLKNLLHCIVDNYFGKGNFEANLRAYLKSKRPTLPLTVAGIVERYAEAALCMADFYRKLEMVSKTTPYPADHLERLLSATNA